MASRGSTQISPAKGVVSNNLEVADTPHQWLMQERALKAKNLLEHSDRTLSEISALCGYANQSHFCRAFLRYFAQSPSTARRQAQVNAELR